MQKHPSLLITGFLLMLSGSAFAHDGLFAHPATSIELVHSLMHMLMLLPLAAGVFFLSRWLIRRSQSATNAVPVKKR